MVFNWFRRKFGSQEEDASPPENKAEVAPQEQAPAVASPTDEPPLNAEPITADSAVSDSPPAPAPSEAVSWAKAAFQRIQQRQQQFDATTEVTPLAKQDLDDEQPPLEKPVPAAVKLAPPTSEQSEERKPAATTPTVKPPSAKTTSTPAVAPTSISSVSQPSPVPSAPSQPPRPPKASPSPPADPSLQKAKPQLDEGFLWSAEVLAAQGRQPDEVSMEEITWLQKLRRGLGKTRQGVVNQLKSVVGQGPLDEEGIMEIETLLLQADTGIKATDTIIEALQNKLRKDALAPDAAIANLKQILCDILDQPLQGNYSATFAPSKDTLNIWLMAGVNGAGKTTTIGKIARIAQTSGYTCLIAAADTFRAAAVEQVKIWGERSQVEVIANPGQNTDPAAVVFDAIAAAQSRGVNLLLVDTAGRLQNKKNLMEELGKVRRIIDKKAPDAKVESLIVLDATLGQNGLRQAEVFSEAAQLTGVVLTKLDGTAKGGIALAVVQQLGLPIRFIGAGEGITDLRPFSSYEFVEALLSS